MSVEAMGEGDWHDFLALAAAEGWRVPQVEVALLRGPLAPCAYVLREGSVPRGFASAVSHGRSGWIGNLIIDPAHRGRGYGGRLFAHALETLEGRGGTGIWLTASEQGRPLYERHGFIAVDRIERWVCPPRSPMERSLAVEFCATETMYGADRRAWGESRTDLLDGLVASGQPFACNETVALLQGGSDLQVLGPWYSEACCPRENRQLLTALLAAADPAVEIVCDLLASSSLRPLLAAAGFATAGGTELMVRGDFTGVDLKMTVALASLGSIG